MTFVKNSNNEISCIVVGVSAGGFNALDILTRQLPVSFSLPIIIVQHRVAENDGYLSQHLIITC